MYKVFVNESLLTFSDTPIHPSPQNTQTINPKEAETIIRSLLSGVFSPGDYHIPLSDEEAHRFLTETFEPIAAAGGIVLDKEGKILWIFRRGKWDLPKGKADEGETMEETALREVREECGMQQLQMDRFLGHCYHIYLMGKGKKAAFKTTYWYLMHTADTHFVPQAEEQITDIRFFEKNDPEPLGNTFRSLRDFLADYYVG